MQTSIHVCGFRTPATAMALFAFTEDDPQQRHYILRKIIVPIVVGITILLYTRTVARDAA